LDDAVAHIRRYSTSHTESIITRSQAAARSFTTRVDAAAVIQKLHARGPMVIGEGRTRTKNANT
jgi:glutamate-5-semialdehyde dehydrogenase